MILLFGVQPLAAVSSDLVASMVMKPVGGAVHLRKGTVNRELVTWLVIGSVPAAFAGVIVLKAIGGGEGTQDVVKTCLGVALLFAAGSMVAKAMLDLRKHQQLKAAAAAGDVVEVPVESIVVRKVPTLLTGILGGLVVGMTSVGSGSLMIVALLLLAMASFGESRAEGAPALIAWRLIEAIGYVGVVVSAPVLIANRAGPRLAPVLLTVWSTFVPVGLAVGAWGHGAVADAAGWRAATQASAAAALLLALASIAAYRSSGERADLARPAAESTVDRPLAPAAWYLAAAFGGFATLGIGVLALLPTVLAAQGLGVAEAGRWTAWASFATVPGSLFIALIVRRPAWHRPLVALALLLRSARLKAGEGTEVADLLDRSIAELQTSLKELRDLARGIHPAVLTERGLGPALEALAGRVPIPVELSVASGRLPEAVEAAASDYLPHMITSYLWDVAKSYSVFFENCPVLKAPTPELKDSRLLLVDLVSRVIKQALDLLGIRVVERM